MNDDGFVTLAELLAGQPPEARTRIEADYRKMARQVEDFRAIRLVIEQAPTELARKLNSAEGSFSKLERRTERAMRTLRRFAAKMGVDLQVSILLPDGPIISLNPPAGESASSLPQPTADASA